MSLQLPIEEYFKYHPPTTPERIALHDRVNRESLDICICLQTIQKDFNSAELDLLHDRAEKTAKAICHDPTCIEWALSALAEAVSETSFGSCYPEEDSERESSVRILMHVQQFRMFLNQGIVVDELKQQKLAEGMAAVTTDNMAKLEEIGKKFGLIPIDIDAEIVTTSLDVSADGTVIKGSVILEPKPKPEFNISHNFNTLCKIKIEDGNKWCAVIGENLQVGIAGFGDDPIAALSDLYAKLQGIEIDNIYASATTQDEQDSLCVRYTTKEIISTYIKSILPVAETIDKHRTFIEAYGQALFERDEDGLSDREKLLAMKFDNSLLDEVDD